MRKKTLKFILKVIISAAFVFWIVFKVSWNEVLFYVKEINFWQALLYVATFIIGIFISGQKWKMLAGEKNIKSSLWNFSKYYLTGAFINNFMPSFIGGDTYRAYQIGKESNNRYIESASAVLVDRLTGFIGTTILVLFFSVINIFIVIKSPVLILLNILVLSLFGIDIALIILKKFSFWQKIMCVMPQSIIKVTEEMKKYNSNHLILKKAIFMGILFNLVGVGMANYILFWAFGINIGILNYCTVIFLISIISAIPVSINNIGIKEWAYVTLFGIFGIDPSAAVTVAIISRFLQMLVSFVAIPVYLKNKTDDIILPNNVIKAG